MKQILIISIFLIAGSFAASDNFWREQDGKMIAANKVLVKLAAETAPMLGSENALSLSKRTTLTDDLIDLGAIDFYPVFINHSTFTEKHYAFELHQFYVIEFQEAIDIFSMLSNLKTMDLILDAEANYQVTTAMIPNDQFYPDQWGHDNYGQAGFDNVGIPDCDLDTDLAWDVSTGSEDVIIAILDTGISNHEEFEDRLLPGWNVINDDDNTNDVYGHGTQCAGIAAASGNNGVGIAGIAWEAKLLPVKILSDDGIGDQIILANGIQYAVDHNASIVSLSVQFGWDFVGLTDNAINYAVANGTVVMAASGNFNQSLVTYPAQYDNCICIGSLSPCNERKSLSSCDGEGTWGSNYGEDLDFLTPGVLINTTTNYGSYVLNFSGTSSACPAGAGVAALVMSVAPELSPASVRDILNNSCDDLYDEGWDSQSGYGRLNAHSAVTLAFEMGCSNNWIPGDVNNDTELNVLDLVSIVNIIVGLNTDPGNCQEWAADFNEDEIINVLDIIQIINVIIV